MQIRDLGGLEFAIMLGIAICAYAESTIYVVLVGASLLTLTTIYEYTNLHSRLIRTGPTAVAGTVLGTVAMSLLFSLICFAIGRIFASLT